MCYLIASASARCVLCAGCCVLCVVCCALRVVLCVLCALCCVLCVLCCVLCGACCVLCAVCCVLCVCVCVLCAVWSHGSHASVARSCVHCLFVSSTSRRAVILLHYFTSLQHSMLTKSWRTGTQPIKIPHSPVHFPRQPIAIPNPLLVRCPPVTFYMCALLATPRISLHLSCYTPSQSTFHVLHFKTLRPFPHS